MKAPRLLVLNYHAPPSTAVGGLRWWGLSKYLARMGWDVTLLAQGDPADTFAPPGVRVVRVPRARVLRDRYQAWRREAATAPAEGGAAGSGRSEAVVATPAGVLQFLREELRAVLTFPDDSRGWLARAMVRGREVVSELAPDIIVSSGPPHSVHSLARLLGAGSRTRFVMDYRDPWIGHQPASRAGTLVLRGLEARLVASSDALLTTTPELVRYLRERFPRASVEWLSNGVDLEALPERVPPATDGLEVVHVGSLYFNRDPTPVIDGLRAFLRAHPDAAARTVVRFIGPVEEPHLSVLKAVRAEAGMPERVQLVGAVPRREALGAISRAHLALVLAQRQADMVPAKLYESVGMDVPTLVITEPGSATALTAERIGALHRAPGDIGGIASVFADAIGGRLRTDAARAQGVSHEALAVRAAEALRAGEGRSARASRG